MPFLAFEQGINVRTVRMAFSIPHRNAYGVHFKNGPSNGVQNAIQTRTEFRTPFKLERRSDKNTDNLKPLTEYFNIDLTLYALH